MSVVIGWGLAVIAVAMGWVQYGWPGVALAVSVVVFWLLLQFSRAMRAMKLAARRPVGSIDSAVMLHARLRPGMTMMQLITLTRSLGERVSAVDGGATECWRWTDDGAVSVLLQLRGGKLAAWTLQRGDQTVLQDSAGVDSAAGGLTSTLRSR